MNLTIPELNKTYLFQYQADTVVLILTSISLPVAVRGVYYEYTTVWDNHNRKGIRAFVTDSIMARRITLLADRPLTLEQLQAEYPELLI